jgi:hypothetical protein
MMPRFPNPAVASKLTRQLSAYSPAPLRLPRRTPAPLANPLSLQTYTIAARQWPLSRTLSSHLLNPSPFTTTPFRPASTTSASLATADGLIEQITDLYNVARDEFEIAAEETEKKSTYGPDDREAAHEAFVELKAVYDGAVGGGGEVGAEVERRVGGRIRELEHALKNMDELAMED